ncbi:uncharacterized protein LOC131437585 [Malaya genurostris]|uniref:uncharacterized protein LOC131437585 n=1 Tax=Malaya genurostris TaxID=325434 RepID=UPI0026F3AE56|nr:uncharacterized protein LOC131437585 [Malaya genurostris]
MFTKVILLAVALQASRVAADVSGVIQADLMEDPVFTFACNNNFGAGCTACKAAQVCLGTENVADVDCTVTPATPYCNKDQCSSVPAEGCQPDAQVEKFICTAEGFFPDPKQCGNYHYCEKANAISDLYNCPTGYVYNPVTGLCKRNSSASDCVVIKCPSASGYGSYGTNKTLYAYCRYAGTPAVLTQTIVFKCAPNSAFDGSTCVYQCSKEGKFENTVNKSTYYECSILGGKWVSTLNNCPTNKKFDPTKQVCVTQN